MSQSYVTEDEVLRAIKNTFAEVMTFNIRQGVSYLRDDYVVKVTRQRKPGARDRSGTFLVTIGEPAFLQREFIKACKKAGEPFPVRKIQWKNWPKKRKS